MPSFVTHLESAIEPGVKLDHRILQTLHADRPLLVRYDLEAIKAQDLRGQLKDRPADIWRYRELLPVENDENIVTLGEGMSPILAAPKLGRELGGLNDFYIKDESQLPTGSFKSRGLCLAVSRAKELGVKRLAIPTAGNAGGALAAYAARAGIEAYIFMPADTPIVNQYEAALFGAKTFLVDGLIGDCGAIVKAGKEHLGWFDCSTLKEPYRIEGKKTMGLELAEQFHWQLPDVIFYPTGGGTGLIGMWKAFHELKAIGWLPADVKMPRMIACQSSGCAPIVAAYDQDKRHADPFPNAATIASGLRVPAAVGDFLILDAVRASNGQARTADESTIIHYLNLAAQTEGISLCPETAVCLGVLQQLVEENAVQPQERIVVFNTGAAQKYLEAITTPIPPLPKSTDGTPDWQALAADDWQFQS